MFYEIRFLLIGLQLLLTATPIYAAHPPTREICIPICDIFNGECVCDDVSSGRPHEMGIRTRQICLPICHPLTGDCGCAGSLIGVDVGGNYRSGQHFICLPACHAGTGECDCLYIPTGSVMEPGADDGEVCVAKCQPGTEICGCDEKR